MVIYKILVATENNMQYQLLDIRDTALVKYTWDVQGQHTNQATINCLEK